MVIISLYFHVEHAETCQCENRLETKYQKAKQDQLKIENPKFGNGAPTIFRGIGSLFRAVLGLGVYQKILAPWKTYNYLSILAVAKTSK
jgi:hypothetical protein